METLRSRFATAQKGYAAIEDDELAPGVLAEVRCFKSELADAEKALNLAVAVEAEGGVRNFQGWWDEKKETILVAVVGKYQYDGITRIDVAGKKVGADPDFVVVDGEAWRSTTTRTWGRNRRTSWPSPSGSTWTHSAGC